MTPEAIEQVRMSWDGVASQPRQLAARFYHELFAIAPNLRPLFPSDLTALQGHFEAAIALVIRHLDEIGALRESLRELGAQHVHWGARPEDYVSAREALIAAIRGLAPSWSIALEGHWRQAVTQIIIPMLEGAAVHTAMMAERLAENVPELE